MRKGRNLRNGNGRGNGNNNGSGITLFELIALIFLTILIAAMLSK